ncbi:MAG: glycosyltransferase family 2 protein [Anaerolineae bacterium]|nr:glycosyltransferase family 2 protein [Anaerolineae bacterium]
MPLVSVVMPVYNGGKYLGEAIESILSQTLSDLELVIVDDCSTDGSAAIAREYTNRDERVRLIQHDRNQGEASTRNSGIAASRGEFIAAMDCDDVSLPRRLEKQVGFLQSHPNIGLVGTFLQTASADLTGRQSHEYPLQHAFIVLYWILSGGTTCAGPAFMARRDILMSVGGYEESRRIVDDKELFSRLYGKTRFANLPDALYLHRQHDGQISTTLPQEQKIESFAIRLRWLKRIGVDASGATLERFDRQRWGSKFGWLEWWLLRRDFKRLINGMVAAKILVESDMPLVEAEMSGRLESAKPRRWQQFIHWRRHRFQ